jgi:hypothetical protein
MFSWSALPFVKRSAYALHRIQHSREQTFVFERREGLYGEPDKDLASY